jgi:hypothetical protein
MLVKKIGCCAWVVRGDLGDCASPVSQGAVGLRHLGNLPA